MLMFSIIVRENSLKNRHFPWHLYIAKLREQGPCFFDPKKPPFYSVGIIQFYLKSALSHFLHLFFYFFAFFFDFFHLGKKFFPKTTSTKIKKLTFGPIFYDFFVVLLDFLRFQNHSLALTTASVFYDFGTSKLNKMKKCLVKLSGRMDNSLDEFGP